VREITEHQPQVTLDRSSRPDWHRMEIRRERREEHRIIQQYVYPRQLLRKMQQLSWQLRLPRRHGTAYSAKHDGLDHF